jgi:molecular chaperone DnaK
MEGEAPTVLTNQEGKRTNPSIVHYGTGDNEQVVGDLAKRLLVAEPERTVRSVKRLMGRRFIECQVEIAPLGYHVEPTGDDDVRIRIGAAALTPEAVSSHILMHLKEVAESYLGESVDQAVITVPAYFNDTQRQATKIAAELAGLDVLRIVNEPTAACLAYGIDKDEEMKIAIFDLGGGTFDVSLLEVDDGVFEVKSTCGDNTLGGDNFDTQIAEHIRKKIQEFSGFDAQSDGKAWQRVVEVAEKVKCELSNLEKTSVSLPFIGMVDNQPVHYEADITREEMESVIEEDFARLAPPCKQALEDAGWEPDEVDVILLVGGSTRMPKVRAIAEEIFGKPPSTEVNPDEVVAMGAAILGGVLTGALAEVLLLDVTPLSLGLASQGDLFNVLIPRNSSIPCEASNGFTTTRDFQRSVKLSVYQGERKVASENRVLSKFRLENITPAPKGVPHINVTFRIDANGILVVSATDISTGAQQEVEIESFMASKEESEAMMKDAERAMEEDRAFIQTSALRIKAAKIQEAAQALIDDYPKISDEEKRELGEAIVRIDVAFHLGDGDMLDENMRALAMLAQKQGDDWLAVKIRFGLDQQGSAI